MFLVTVHVPSAISASDAFAPITGVVFCKLHANSTSEVALAASLPPTGIYKSPGSAAVFNTLLPSTISAAQP